MSRLTFVCSGCGSERAADPAEWRCPLCESPLEIREHRPFAPDMIDHSAAGIWRYRRAMAIDPEQSIGFNEPTTSLTPVSIAGRSVFAKLDGQLPTGSFKDRGMALLVSWLASSGIKHVVEDSSGNAAASIAGYAARAGLGCTVYAPAHASPGKLVQAAAFGAKVELVHGSRDDVARAAEQAALEPGSAYATHNWHPLFIEGVKSWLFEVWEQLGCEMPDVVIAPAGSGSLILGAWHAAGQLGQVPRIYAAQAAACEPLVAALDAEATETVTFKRTPSIAEGIMIANPVRGRTLLKALRMSGGSAIAIDEPTIRTALLETARQGIFIEPTSATAWAAAELLISSGEVKPDERVVVLCSGNGLKATAAIGEMLTNSA